MDYFINNKFKYKISYFDEGNFFESLWNNKLLYLIKDNNINIFINNLNNNLYNKNNESLGYMYNLSNIDFELTKEFKGGNLEHIDYSNFIIFSIYLNCHNINNISNIREEINNLYKKYNNVLLLFLSDSNVISISEIKIINNLNVNNNYSILLYDYKSVEENKSTTKVVSDFQNFINKFKVFIENDYNTKINNLLNELGKFKDIKNSKTDIVYNYINIKFKLVEMLDIKELFTNNIYNNNLSKENVNLIDFKFNFILEEMLFDYLSLKKKTAYNVLSLISSFYKYYNKENERNFVETLNNNAFFPFNCFDIPVPKNTDLKSIIDKLLNYVTKYDNNKNNKYNLNDKENENFDDINTNNNKTPDKSYLNILINIENFYLKKIKCKTFNYLEYQEYILILLIKYSIQTKNTSRLFNLLKLYFEKLSDSISNCFNFLLSEKFYIIVFCERLNDIIQNIVINQLCINNFEDEELKINDVIKIKCLINVIIRKTLNYLIDNVLKLKKLNLHFFNEEINLEENDGEESLTSLSEKKINARYLGYLMGISSFSKTKKIVKIDNLITLKLINITAKDIKDYIISIGEENCLINEIDMVDKLKYYIMKSFFNMFEKQDIFNTIDNKNIMFYFNKIFYSVNNFYSYYSENELNYSLSLKIINCNKLSSKHQIQTIPYLFYSKNYKLIYKVIDNNLIESEKFSMVNNYLINIRLLIINYVSKSNKNINYINTYLTSNYFTSELKSKKNTDFCYSNKNELTDNSTNIPKKSLNLDLIKLCKLNNLFSYNVLCSIISNYFEDMNNNFNYSNNISNEYNQEHENISNYVNLNSFIKVELNEDIVDKSNDFLKLNLKLTNLSLINFKITNIALIVYNSENNYNKSIKLVNYIANKDSSNDIFYLSEEDEETYQFKIENKLKFSLIFKKIIIEFINNIEGLIELDYKYIACNSNILYNKSLLLSTNPYNIGFSFNYYGLNNTINNNLITNVFSYNCYYNILYNFNFIIKQENENFVIDSEYLKIQYKISLIDNNNNNENNDILINCFTLNSNCNDSKYKSISYICTNTNIYKDLLSINNNLSNGFKIDMPLFFNYKFKKYDNSISLNIDKIINCLKEFSISLKILDINNNIIQEFNQIITLNFKEFKNIVYNNKNSVNNLNYYNNDENLLLFNEYKLVNSVLNIKLFNSFEQYNYSNDLTKTLNIKSFYYNKKNSVIKILNSIKEDNILDNEEDVINISSYKSKLNCPVFTILNNVKKRQNDINNCFNCVVLNLENNTNIIYFIDNNKNDEDIFEYSSVSLMYDEYNKTNSLNNFQNNGINIYEILYLNIIFKLSFKVNKIKIIIEDNSLWTSIDKNLIILDTKDINKAYGNIYYIEETIKIMPLIEGYLSLPNILIYYNKDSSSSKNNLLNNRDIIYLEDNLLNRNNLECENLNISETSLDYEKFEMTKENSEVVFRGFNEIIKVNSLNIINSKVVIE